MKKKVTVIALLGLIVLLLTGAFLVVLLNITGKEKGQKESKDLTMFSAYTECEAFQNVPAMKTTQGKISDAENYGKENYLIGVNGSSVEEYKAYLTLLEETLPESLKKSKKSNNPIKIPFIYI